ncbi:sulfatase-like hydrolase/transferase [Pseudomonadota bacterium]
MQKALNTIKRFPYIWIAVLLVVISIQIIELLFLQRKYDLFTGGFLQPHSYSTWTERVEFIGLSLWMDLALFGVLGLIWHWISNRLDIKPILSTYNFVFLVLLSMGTWLTVKFKALSYFSDTLNFQIIKNLGGGSLLEALTYVANEAVIIGVGIIILLTIYWLGFQWIRNYVEDQPLYNNKPVRSRYVWVPLAIFCLFTIGLTAYINSDSSLRYGLEKKTSYALISKTLNQLSDLDRDGFGLFRYPEDPNNMDSRIYPGALDYPGNGADEDGYGGDFQWHAPSTDPLGQLPPAAGKHILLIMLESGRADMVSKIWQQNLVTPNITALANQGSSAEYAYSHHGFTTTSLKALFNRTFSQNHDRIILTDYLQNSGYTLSFISGQDESFGDVASSTGMDMPNNYFFDARSALEDRVYASTESASLRLSEERIVRQFYARTVEVDWDRPQFFYVNLQAAHFPYSYPTMPSLINEHPIKRSEINKSNQNHLEATYWNAIAVADHAVGAMLKRLSSLGVLNDTVIMVLSDHGESLFDDDFLGHGHALNEAQTRIPLIINQPGIDIRSAIGLVDIAELIVRLATGRYENNDFHDLKQLQLQFVGSLNTPQLVGTVSYGEVRTILDLRTREVYFSDLNLWKGFDEAWEDSFLRPRVKELIALWEKARWEDHLSRKKNPVDIKE